MKFKLLVSTFDSYSVDIGERLFLEVHAEITAKFDVVPECQLGSFFTNIRESHLSALHHMLLTVETEYFCDPPFS